MIARIAIIASAMMTAPGLAMADDDADLIPRSVLDEPPGAPEATPPRRFEGKFFLENAVTLSAYDGVLVPYPPSLAVGWQSRTSFDAHVLWKPLPTFTFTLSDRLNLYLQDQQLLLSPDTVRNDLREGYVTWEPQASLYLEAGRINVRNGAALGFNPTDFFKTRSLVGQASLDPAVIRQNRLGTLMVRAQAIWPSGSASLAFAPKMVAPSPVAESDPLGVDPHLGASNAANRVLGTLSLDVLNLSPQVLGYLEPGRSKVGLNLTYAMGDAAIVYAEWAGGPEKNLIARGIAFGRETGTLPQAAPLLPSTSTSTSFRNDLAGGLSWTGAARVTVNLEYHFHQSGFGRGDWNSWFDLGSAPGASAALTGELWYLRGYGNDQQEPMTQHQAFVRASWPRAFVPDLELTTFAFVDLLGGSVLGQVSASYYLSSRWTASFYLSSDLGPARAERGSFPQRLSSIFQLTAYL